MVDFILVILILDRTRAGGADGDYNAGYNLKLHHF